MLFCKLLLPNYQYDICNYSVNNMKTMALANPDQASFQREVQNGKEDIFRLVKYI